MNSKNQQGNRSQQTWKGNPTQRYGQDSQWQRGMDQKGRSRSNHYRKCHNCGSNHARDQCPAKDQTCHKCKKVWHYKGSCRSKPGKFNPWKKDFNIPQIKINQIKQISKAPTVKIKIKITLKRWVKLKLYCIMLWICQSRIDHLWDRWQ